MSNRGGAVVNIDLKNNKKASYIFNTVGLLICVVMFTYIYTNYVSPTPVSVNAPLKTQDDVSKKAQPKQDENSKSNESSGSVTKNPFIDLSELRIASTNGKNTIPNGAAVSSASGNNGLPQIPSGYPRPNVGNIPLPSIPGGANVPPMVTAQASQTAPTSVKGVFTGNNGNNMAIMSDGKIVSTGDTYQDGRIAYIGGDGIQFDDGHTISYK